MGLVWTGESFTDKNDGKKYIINIRRVQSRVPNGDAKSSPGHESKLTSQTYFDQYDGTLIRPGCNCNWEERAAGHVCDRRRWRIMNRRAKRAMNRSFR